MSESTIKAVQMLKHPSGQNRFTDLATRFMKLKGAHRKAASAMWIGTLAAAFTDEELNALQDYLSPGDVQALRQVRQPVKTEVARSAFCPTKELQEK